MDQYEIPLGIQPSKETKQSPSSLIDLVHRLEDLLKVMLEQEGSVEETIEQFQSIMETMLPGCYPKAITLKPRPYILTDVTWDTLTLEQQEWLIQRKKRILDNSPDFPEHYDSPVFPNT